MVKTAILNKIIDNNDLELIEKGLFKSFLKENNLNYEQCDILKNYLIGFDISDQLRIQIKELKIESFNDLEKYLELLIPSTDRQLNGAFFTPDFIVKFIINKVNPIGQEKCVDISCGCGAFLIGLIDHFKENNKTSIKTILKDNIYGYDILDYNVRRTKLLIAIYALINNEVVLEEELNIFQCDSLRENWDKKFDVIVGNPPYVKFQDLSVQNREFLSKKKWESIDNGTFNLYFAFFELGFQLLTNSGRLGYITPNNYFTSLAGESLRRFFSKNKCIYLISDFSHRKVFNALTYTCITILNKKINDEILFDRIKNDQNFEEYLKDQQYSKNDWLELNNKKWRLLKSDERKNINTIENIGDSIGKLFDISVGIATLKDDLYFVDGSNGEVKKELDGKTFFIEKEVTKAVYKISDFKNQEEIQQNSRRVIFPYKSIKNKVVRIDEDEMRTKYPKCYEYLLTIKDILNARDKGKVAYDPFYEWGRLQGLKTGIRLLTPTFSQIPRFIIVNDHDSFFTNGYGIFFRKNESLSMFDQNPITNEHNIKAVKNILNSIVMDYYISRTSVSIDGGYPCYQKNFIEKFSIPNFSISEIDYLNNSDDKAEIDKFLIEKYSLII